MHLIVDEILKIHKFNLKFIYQLDFLTPGNKH